VAATAEGHKDPGAAVGIAREGDSIMAASRRWGLTLPLPGITLADHRAVLAQAERLGYTDAWSGEADYGDAFTPLAVAAGCTARMRLGTGIANTFTRGPETLAASAFSLADAAPGRFCLGLGSSSDTIVRERYLASAVTRAAPMCPVRQSHRSSSGSAAERAVEYS
jgi:alkanesulfonate monooxygenase SsuD/methylene tetrahydromethanopterin reductase-like flavin-dependent oxidoreductase (luciferase family)